MKQTHNKQAAHTSWSSCKKKKKRKQRLERAAAPASPADLLFGLYVQLIPRHQLEHVFQGQGQEFFGHGHLHEVLVDEAVGCVVQHSAHHGLGKLADAQAIFGVQTFGIRKDEKKFRGRMVSSITLRLVLGRAGEWRKPSSALSLAANSLHDPRCAAQGLNCEG